MSGYVYLISDGEFCKIGIAADVAARLLGLQTANPRELRILHLIEVSNPNALEEELHIRFEHKRVRGEWFRFDDVDIQWIKSAAWETIGMPEILARRLRLLRRAGIPVEVEMTNGVLTIRVHDVVEMRDAEGVYFAPKT